MYAASAQALQDDAVSSLITDASTSTYRALHRQVMVWFGDSWSDPATPWNNNNAYIPRSVAKSLGCELHNYAVGGTGISTGSTPFAAQVKAAADDAAFGNNDVAWAICFGGINDRKNPVDNGAINSLFDLLTSSFPNARRVMIPMQHAWNINDWGNTFNWLNSYRRNGSPGVAVIEGASFWALGDNDSFINSNPGHPNTLGCNIYATKILSALTGGSPKSNWKNLSFKPNSGVESNLVVAVSEQPGMIELNGYVKTSDDGDIDVGYLDGQVLSAMRRGTLFAAPQTTANYAAGNDLATFLQFNVDSGSQPIADYIGPRTKLTLRSAKKGIAYYFWQNISL